MTTRPTLFAKSLFTMMILVNSSYANTTPPQDKTPSQTEARRQDELKAQMEAKIRLEQRALQRANAHHHELISIQDPITHKYGYQDAQGNVVIKPIYDEIEKFNGTSMIVVKSDLYGVINRDGKVIIDTVYDDIIRQDSHYIVKKQGLFGVLDENGKVVIDLTNDELHDVKAIKAHRSKSAYFAKKQGKYGMYDDKGEVILPFEYDKHGKIEQGILPVSKNGKWGMIKFTTDQYHGIDFDKPYHVMVDFGLDYDFIYGFTDELSLVVKDDKYGFIDKTGKLVSGLDYDFALPFYAPILKIKAITNPSINNEPIAFVGKKSGDKIQLGAIDKTGKAVIPLIYDNIQSDLFTHLIIVIKDGKFGVVGRTGSSVLPLVYDNVKISPMCFMPFDLFPKNNNQPRQCTIYTLKDGVEGEVSINY